MPTCRISRACFARGFAKRNEGIPYEIKFDFDRKKDNAQVLEGPRMTLNTSMYVADGVLIRAVFNSSLFHESRSRFA